VSDTIPQPLEPRPEPAHSERAGRSRSARNVIVGAVAGGLVGALAAGGVFVALDDGGSSTTRIIEQQSPAAVTRASKRIASTGDIAAIIAKAEPSVVAIDLNGGIDNSNGGAGTGFVISGDGYIVTNSHVVENADSIEVFFTDGNQKKARVVGRDPTTDLAVLKVDAQGLTPVELGDSESVQVGDEVVAIGNALALEGGLSVTRGIISGLDRTVPEDNGAVLFGGLQTDAAINPGNSGGPLLDAQGRVIGINTAGANPAFAQNVGFAIPISKAQPTIDALRANRALAFLGVSTQNVTPALARELDLKVKRGAYVKDVTAGTPAEDAGVRNGDVILQIGDDQINGSDDVQSAVRSRRPGDTVAIVINRDGEEQTIEAKLIERRESS
jgi:S1-C subfamily serine protease